jgi:hypothetical protein
MFEGIELGFYTVWKGAVVLVRTVRKATDFILSGHCLTLMGKQGILKWNSPIPL